MQSLFSIPWYDFFVARNVSFVGDAYIAAIGIHPSNAISSQSGRVDDSSTHDDQLASERRMENASTCVNFALSVIEHLQSLPQNSNVEDPLVAFRMGIHIGYCTVCVLGEDMKTFEIFGGTSRFRLERNASIHSRKSK